MKDWADLATDLLPPVLQDFVRLIGLQPTMALVERFGGLRIYIPANPGPDHQLSQLIGYENLQNLSKEYGTGERLDLPKAERALTGLRNAKIIAQYGPKSMRTLAAEHHLTERQITRILAAAQAQNDSQTDLFG